MAAPVSPRRVPGARTRALYLLAGAVALAGAALATGDPDWPLLGWAQALIDVVLAIVCLAIASGRFRATPVADGVSLVVLGVAVQQVASAARTRGIGGDWWGLVSLASVLVMIGGVCVIAGIRSRPGQR